MFRGTYTALVTPFRDGTVDEPAFRALVEAQIRAGVDGVVPVGTTGESPTLDHAEHLRVIELAVQAAAGRCKVMAGTGSNATSEAVSLTREAAKAGADSALLVAPYYNRPTQEGLYRHFRAIASATDLPLVLYSIPSRCGVEIGVETAARLAADCPTIRAIKESGGNADRVSQLRAALPPDFAVMSGDDALTLPFLALGATGVVSVASNVIPAEVAKMVSAFLAGDRAEALAIHCRYYQLFKDLFIETNPAPAKAALALMGRISPEVRLPLCEMSPPNLARLRATLARLGLIPE